MKNWMEDYAEMKAAEVAKPAKETAYGSWEDFERETGMTKEQYMAREKKNAEELAEMEVETSILRRQSNEKA